MKKSHYEVPTSELLVVRFEENIMSPGAPGTAGNLGYEENLLDDLGD